MVSAKKLSKPRTHNYHCGKYFRSKVNKQNSGAACLKIRKITISCYRSKVSKSFFMWFHTWTKEFITFVHLLNTVPKKVLNNGQKWTNCIGAINFRAEQWVIIFMIFINTCFLCCNCLVVQGDDLHSYIQNKSWTNSLVISHFLYDKGVRLY